MNERDEEDRRAKTSIPPPITGYWAWVRDELKSKADEKWAISELKSLRRMFDDTKVTAKDAKTVAERPYVCTQMREIEELKTWQYKITNWKIPAIISIVVLVISGVGQYFSLKDSVDDGNEARTEVQETLSKIEATQARTSEVITLMKEQISYSERQRSEDMKNLLQQVVSTMKDEVEPRKRTRRADRTP